MAANTTAATIYCAVLCCAANNMIAILKFR